MALKAKATGARAAATTPWIKAGLSSGSIRERALAATSAPQAR